MSSRALVLSLCRSPGTALTKAVSSLAMRYDEVVVAVDDSDDPQLAPLPTRWHSVRQLTAGISNAWCTTLPLTSTVPSRQERVAALPVWLGAFAHVVVDAPDVASMLRSGAGQSRHSYVVELVPRLGDNGPPPMAPPTTNRALVITRAQPFHRGHLALVERALDVAAEAVVVVAAADRSHLPTDPFTAGERLAFVRASLGAMAPRIWLMAAPRPSWPGLALTTMWRLAPPVSCVVAHNRTLSVMATEMGWTVHRLTTPVCVNGDPISGTALRTRLAGTSDDDDDDDEQAWLRHRVPDGVADCFAADRSLRNRLRVLSLPEHG